jgi:hypothetical protein
MSALREFSYFSDDVITIMADIDDCPLLEIPLTELFDLSSFTLVENYLQVLERYVIELLEDTVWMDIQSFLYLLSADFDLFYPTNEGERIAMLRQPFQQRILQILRYSHAYDHEFELSILISFRVHASDLPRHQLRPTDSRSPPESTTTTNKRLPTSKYQNVESTGAGTLFRSSCVSDSNQSKLEVDALSVPVKEDLYYEFGSTCRGDNEDENCVVDSTQGIGVVDVQEVNVFDSLSCDDDDADTILVGSTTGLFAEAINPLMNVTFPNTLLLKNSIIATFQYRAPTTAGFRFIDQQKRAAGVLLIWAAVCYQAAIKNSNRLLLSINMRFHPIDRGRLLKCTG